MTNDVTFRDTTVMEFASWYEATFNSDQECEQDSSYDKLAAKNIAFEAWVESAKVQIQNLGKAPITVASSDLTKEALDAVTPLLDENGHVSIFNTVSHRYVQYLCDIGLLHYVPKSRGLYGFITIENQTKSVDDSDGKTLQVAP